MRLEVALARRIERRRRLAAGLWAGPAPRWMPAVPLNLPLKPGPDRPRMAGYGPSFVFEPGFLGFLGPRLGGVRFPFPAPVRELDRPHLAFSKAFSLEPVTTRRGTRPKRASMRSTRARVEASVACAYTRSVVATVECPSILATS